MMTDMDWLCEIAAAALARQALAGVPLSVSARLTQNGWVQWIGQTALTITSQGHMALDRSRSLSACRDQRFTDY